MPSITDQFKEELRSRSDIVDVIGEYVTLWNLSVACGRHLSW